jgi:CheY-like chemotaxis protein
MNAGVGFRLAWSVGGGASIAAVAWFILAVLDVPLNATHVAVIGLVSMIFCAIVHEVSTRNGWRRGESECRTQMSVQIEEKSQIIQRNRELSRRRVRALATAISGRLNNVLMVMLGSIEMANRRATDNMLKSELNTIRLSIDDASSVCRRLARISTQGERGSTCSSDLADHVRRILPSVRARAGTAIHLRIEIDAKELYVRVAPKASDQLLISAVNNHLSTIQPGGSLRIRAWADSIYDLSITSSETILEIESTGTESLEKTPELMKILRAIPGARLDINRHGRLRCIRVALPTADSDGSSYQLGFETGSWRNPISSDILVVEDDKQVRDLLTRMLDSYDSSILTASTVEDACGLLKERSDTIGLAIIDVVLPGVSGLKLAEAIRVKYPQIPVLVMTGSATRGLTNRLATDSAVTLLRKPFMQTALDEAIERLVPLNDISVVAP